MVLTKVPTKPLCITIPSARADVSSRGPDNNQKDLGQHLSVHKVASTCRQIITDEQFPNSINEERGRSELKSL